MMVSAKSVPLEFNDIHYVLGIENFNFVTFSNDLHKVDSFVHANDFNFVFWVFCIIFSH